ncbi:MAG: FadR family transcriptional regulator [Firmicutes bacterium]|nr:FadR family transcriptional regulator [Bacillota bacterium]
MPFFRVEKQRLYQSVVEQLVEFVKNGGVSPGQRFPSERELEKQLGVSRGILREAFRVLEVRGLIESRPGGGRFLREVTPPVLFQDGTTLYALEKSVLLDIAEARMALEVTVARLAAQRATEEDIGNMSQVIESFYSASDPEPGEDRDLDFHLSIARATHNFVLHELVKMQMNLLREYHQQAHLNRQKWEALCAEHKRILQAIASRDAEAAAGAMDEHLRGLREAIVQAGESNGEG